MRGKKMSIDSEIQQVFQHVDRKAFLAGIAAHLAEATSGVVVMAMPSQEQSGLFLYCVDSFGVSAHEGEGLFDLGRRIWVQDAYGIYRSRSRGG